MRTSDDPAKCVASQSTDGKHMLISVAPFLEPHGAVHVPAETLRKLHDQLGMALRDSEGLRVIPEVHVDQDAEPSESKREAIEQAAEPESEKQYVDTVWDPVFDKSAESRVPQSLENSPPPPQIIEVSQAAPTDDATKACEKKRSLWMWIAIALIVILCAGSAMGAFHLSRKRIATTPQLNSALIPESVQKA